MSSNRSKLKLDEQSFEELLAAAYTVQEHTAKQKRASAAQVPCSQCGTLLAPEHQFCGHCGARRDEFRPGERMQRKWASLWMMSQKQGAVPDFGGTQTGAILASNPPAETVDVPAVLPEPLWSEDPSPSETEAIRITENNDLDLREALLVPSGDDFSDEPAPAELMESMEAAGSETWNLRLILKFHRADLYLAVAILVSALALSWVIWATPVSRGAAKVAQLSLWERTLVAIGIAEAPAAPVIYRGDPNAKVWADPHTALYYCSGAEQFGKTHGGHFSTQREAQMDRFSPAARTPCD